MTTPRTPEGRSTNVARLPAGSVVTRQQSGWGLVCRHYFPRGTACCERTASMLVKCVCGARRAEGPLRKDTAAAVRTNALLPSLMIPRQTF